MKILSLFDGMSCGQLAIDRIGIKNYTYYASEIDKYAIQIAKKNFPNTIHIGDVTAISPGNLPKIDLLIGGSPCQGFSFAGKQLAFDDPRSKLFFEYVRLLKELKPKYFLLENVRMKKEYLDIITEYLGVEPVLINSSLFSAQNRQRYYWTNIPFNKNIIDKGVVLKDILEEGFNTERDKSHCLDANYYKGSSVENYKKKSRRQMVFESPKQVGIATNINGHDILKRVYSPEGKSPTINTMNGGNREPKVMVKSYREVRTEEAKKIRKEVMQSTGKDHTPFRSKELVERKDGKVGTITPSLNNDHKISLTKDITEDIYWRKLTPLECERLQTVPDNYTEGVSNTQRYKMLGNGWTVNVISHILKNMEVTI